MCACKPLPHIPGVNFCRRRLLLLVYILVFRNQINQVLNPVLVGVLQKIHWIKYQVMITQTFKRSIHHQQVLNPQLWQLSFETHFKGTVAPL